MKRYFLLFIFIFASFASSFAQKEIQEKVFELANAYRKDKKLTPLKWSDDLYKAALHHATYLQEINAKVKSGEYVLTHSETQKTQTVEAIKEYTKRIEKHTSSNFNFSNENCLYTFTSEPINAQNVAKEMIDIWKNSPPHNANMLNKEVNHVGIATVMIPVPKEENSFIIFCVWVAAEFY